MDALTADGNADINGNADVSGTLNVDGASAMAAITADGAADLQAGLNVDGATTMDALTADGNADINGDLDVDGAAIDLSATGDMHIDAEELYMDATTIIDMHAGPTTWLHVSDAPAAIYNNLGSEVSMASDMIYLDAPEIILGNGFCDRYSRR